MKSVARLLVLLACFIGISVSVIANNGNPDMRVFSEYGCSMRLPDKNIWKWGDPQKGPEETIALANSNDGMILMLSAEKRTENVSFEILVEECERDSQKEANVRKMSGKKVSFLDVPAYDLVLLQMDAGMKLFTRSFLKNQIEYCLALIVPKNVRVNRSIVEKYYKVFAWSEITNVPQTEEDKQGSFAYYGPQDYKRFPQYHCQIRLPNKNTWKWGQQDDVLAFAECQDGVMLQLVVKTAQDAGANKLVFNDKFIKGFEEGLFNREGIQKISSKKLNFKEVPAHQVTGHLTELESSIIGRIFIKHNNAYMLQIFIPQTNVSVDEDSLEPIFNSFSWMITPEERIAQQKAEKESLKKKSYVFKENAVSDDTVYRVSNAKTHQFQKGDVAVQVDIPVHNWVDNRSKTTKAFFNIKADTKTHEGFNKGYTTNIPARIQVYLLERSLEETVDRHIANKERQNDTLLVKEYKESRNNKQVCTLLFVSTFSNNEPCVYEGAHFVEIGGSVLVIEADCAQAMHMSANDRLLFNNIVQSSLKSIKVNGKVIDTKILARHVRKN